MKNGERGMRKENNDGMRLRIMMSMPNNVVPTDHVHVCLETNWVYLITKYKKKNSQQQSSMQLLMIYSTRLQKRER